MALEEQLESLALEQHQLLSVIDFGYGDCN
jgi:hypothetical protein